MRAIRNPIRLLSTTLLASAAVAALSLAAMSVGTAKEKPPQEWDGLVRRENKKLDNVYVGPDVEFKAYKRVSLDPVEVKFDKDWDPNSGSRSFRADCPTRTSRRSARSSRFCFATSSASTWPRAATRWSRPLAMTCFGFRQR